MDTYGHGTTVTGIIASNIYGMAPNAEIYVLRILDSEGNSNGDYFHQAIQYIYVNYFDQNSSDFGGIISISLGYDNGVGDVQEETTSLISLLTNKFLIINSAGNDGEPLTNLPNLYPQRIYYDSVNLNGAFLIIGNVDMEHLEPEDETNYGPSLTLFAPGSAILTTSIPGNDTGSTSNDPNDSFKFVFGTSISTPMVAGGMALMAQYYGPNVTPGVLAARMSRIATKGAMFFYPWENQMVRDSYAGTPNVVFYIGDFVSSSPFFHQQSPFDRPQPALEGIATATLVLVVILTLGMASLLFFYLSRKLRTDNWNRENRRRDHREGIPSFLGRSGTTFGEENDRGFLKLDARYA